MTDTARSPELEWKIKNLPDSPGCYLMKSKGEIIYVGKAKNLKNRVRQYFHASANHTPKVQAMVDKVDDFDIVLVDGELEALILECNLIKQHMPHYNILLKDDKHYPFIRIDLKAPFPAIELMRRPTKDGAKYFGPYIGASAVREVMDTVRTVFPIRHCTKALTEGMHDRPCLHYQTGDCPGPCAGKITSEEYKECLQGVLHFLSGHPEEVVKDLTNKMKAASASMNFERAALLRDKIRAVGDVMQPQKALDVSDDNRDIIAYLPCMEDALVQVMITRGGKLLSSRMYTLEGAAREDGDEVLVRFITQYYSSVNLPAREVLVSRDIPDVEVLEQLLTETAGRKISVFTPKRGEKAALIRMAEKNLEDEKLKIETRTEKKKERTEGALIELAMELGLSDPPRRIEGYDISNTQGAQSVASEVVMIDGETARREYRSYKIKTVEGPNDFASMHEVITRRFTHGLKEREEREAKGLPMEGGSFSDFPDLLLIDGGRGQLSAALDALHALNLDIPAFGLMERIDEIVLPNEDTTIYLDRHSPALHMIERLRDEAHRFAITHHRKLRGAHSIASRLEQIPGIGPKRRKALLTHFKTIEELKAASVKDIAKVDGMGEKFAMAVWQYLHKDDE